MILPASAGGDENIRDPESAWRIATAQMWVSTTRSRFMTLCRDANRATEEWFADTDKVKAKMGMDVDAMVDAVPKRVRSTKVRSLSC